MNHPPDNPFASPQVEKSEISKAKHVCPDCYSEQLEKPRYTNWGGYIGPWVLRHTICQSCGYQFNGGTLRSNTGNIIAYQVFSVFAFISGVSGILWYFGWMDGLW